MTIEEVKAIRRAVFERAEYMCEYCGALLTWNTGHMHEKIHRGRGGKISLENSVALCAKCHIGPHGEHGARRPRFGEN
jgi:5-methylcytosine-specific restriction endonuclease McrA